MLLSVRRLLGAIIFYAGFSLPGTLVFAADWQYTVRPGDTIWSVCREYTDYESCWRELPAYNGVDQPKELSVGERLKVPASWLKQPPVAATAIFVTGDVELERNGQRQPLTARQVLNLGDRVYSTAGSATLQFADGSLLTMAANSEVQLDAVSAFKITRPMKIDIEVPRGEVSVKVPRREPRTLFNVRTPSAVAAVRGTEFRVNAEASSVTRGEVLTGTVALQAGSTEVELDGGFGALAQAGEGVSAPVQLMDAPEWNMECTDPGYVEWQSLPGTDHYRLALLEDDVTADKLLDTKVVTKNRYTFTDLQEKCYQLKVSAVDMQGFNGLESRRQFCYELQLDPPVISSASWVNEKFSLDWGAIQFADSYLVEVSQSEQFDDILLKKKVSAEKLTINMDQAPQEVFVRVQALAGEHRGEYGEPVTLQHETQRGRLIGILAAIAAFAIL